MVSSTTSRGEAKSREEFGGWIGRIGRDDRVTAFLETVRDEETGAKAVAPVARRKIERAVAVVVWTMVNDTVIIKYCIFGVFFLGG